MACGPDGRADRRHQPVVDDERDDVTGFERAERLRARPRWHAIDRFTRIDRNEHAGGGGGPGICFEHGDKHVGLIEPVDVSPHSPPSKRHHTNLHAP
jgi:hypothetical protein